MIQYPIIIVNGHGKIKNPIRQKIETEQKGVMKSIVKRLKIKPPKIITVNLYSTRSLKQKLTGESGNCHATIADNSIHAYVSRGRISLGYHEMVHLLASQLGDPPRLISEGLALWFDGSWHGTSFSELIQKLYHTKKHFAMVKNLFSNTVFTRLPNQLSYSIAGQFAISLVSNFGLIKFIQLYKRTNRKNTVQKNLLNFKKIYKTTFTSYLEKFIGIKEVN